MPTLFFRKNKYYLLAYGLVAGLYALIVGGNHLSYRTYCLDLGLYTNALYQYAHFNLPTTAAVQGEAKLMLADHFDLYLILFSPLIYLFGSYTLLIVQGVSIFIGALGVWRLAHYLKLERSGLYGLLLLLSFGVFTALSFDYHSNVVAAMILPWIVYAIYSSQIGWLITLSFLFLIAKENGGFILSFVLVPFLFEHTGRLRWVLLANAIFGIVYSLVVTQYLMPLLNGGSTFEHYDFSIGSSLSEIIAFAASSPFDFLAQFFGSHITSPEDIIAIKLEFIILSLLSGGILILKRPIFIVAFIPILLQKFLHLKTSVIGIGAHYSIESCVLIVVMVVIISTQFIKQKRQIILTLLLVGTSISTIRIMDNTINYLPKEQIRFYSTTHYKRGDIATYIIKRALSYIPGDAAVSCSHNLFPHLSCRDKIYQFPIVKDAEFIVIGGFNCTYPLDKEQFLQHKQQLIEDSNHVELFNEGKMLVVKKRA